MDMLCIAAQHDPIGLVAINGEGLSVDDIARMAGADPREAATLISELERNDVFARDRKGIIYSRRMVRDAKKAATAKKNGKEGGNPKLGKHKGNSASDKGQLKPPDKPYKLEAKSQELEQRSRAECEALEARLRQAAGAESDPFPGLLVVGPIEGLLAAGYSLELDVIPTIAAKRATGFKPRSWGYYVEAIREARERRLKIAETPAPKAREIDWESRVKMYRERGLWPSDIGPEPGYGGCMVPIEILRNHGYAKAEDAA